VELAAVSAENSPTTTDGTLELNVVTIGDATPSVGLPVVEITLFGHTMMAPEDSMKFNVFVCVLTGDVIFTYRVFIPLTLGVVVNVTTPVVEM
jgi:hypothetical protein